VFRPEELFLDENLRATETIVSLAAESLISESGPSVSLGRNVTALSGVSARRSANKAALSTPDPDRRRQRKRFTYHHGGGRVSYLLLLCGFNRGAVIHARARAFIRIRRGNTKRPRNQPALRISHRCERECDSSRVSSVLRIATGTPPRRGSIRRISLPPPGSRFTPRRLAPRP